MLPPLTRSWHAQSIFWMGHEGEPAEAEHFPSTERFDEAGRRIWKRRLPHPGDGPKNMNEGIEYKRTVHHGGTSITYDLRKLHE